MKLAKSTLSAVAAAIAAAAVLTTVAVPAQAGYKRAATTIVKPGVIKKSRAIKKRKVMMMHITKLSCRNGSGDVVANPLVINTTGKILPAGRSIYWRATLANGSIRAGTYKLTAPLNAGQGRSIPVMLHWNFTCTASVFA